MPHETSNLLIVAVCALVPLAAEAGYYYEAATTSQGAGRDGVTTWQIDVHQMLETPGLGRGGCALDKNNSRFLLEKQV